MPNKNGTGPEGKGPKTGRGIGSCGNGNRIQKGDKPSKGLGLRRRAVNTEKADEKK